MKTTTLVLRLRDEEAEPCAVCGRELSGVEMNHRGIYLECSYCSNGAYLYENKYKYDHEEFPVQKKILIQKWNDAQQDYRREA